MSTSDVPAPSTNPMQSEEVVCIESESADGVGVHPEFAELEEEDQNFFDSSISGPVNTNDCESKSVIVLLGGKLSA